jgi:tetratricopeptide (TPR) repeat protein
MKNFKTTICLAIMVIFSIFLSACSHPEEKKKAEQPAQKVDASNQYTSESVFEKVLRRHEKDPDNVDVLYHLADLYDRSGMYEKATESYQRVIELQPDKGYAYLKLGTAFSRMGKPEKALEPLTKATELLPKPDVAFNNLGMAYGKLNRFDEEIAALNQALAIRPKYAAARYNLAMTYLKKGDRESAMQQYENLKAFDVTAAKKLLQVINRQQP